jgi:hypothetical protein
LFESFDQKHWCGRRLRRPAPASLGAARRPPRAFSSEAGTGSREENASKQESRASVPIQSERKRL